MTRPTRLVLFALATMLIAGTTVHADVILWDYSWSMSPAGGALQADAPGEGKVVFGLEKPGVGANTSDIGAANLRTITEASPSNPDHLGDGGLYTLTLTLTDHQSGLAGSVTFAGKLFGTFSTMSADIHSTFIGPTQKSLELGGYEYVVTIGPYSPPGPPSSINLGGIGARVEVLGGVQIAHAPEPSALALSGCGGIGMLLFSLQRLRRRSMRA